MFAERGRAPRGDLLPETVQGIIAARLDSLLRREKTLLLRRRCPRQGRSGVSALDGGVTVEEPAARAAAEGVRAREQRASRRRRDRVRVPHLLVRDVAYAQIPRVSPRGEARTRGASGSTRSGDRARISRSSSPTTISPPWSCSRPPASTPRTSWARPSMRCSRRHSSPSGCSRSLRRRTTRRAHSTSPGRRPPTSPAPLRAGIRPGRPRAGGRLQRNRRAGGRGLHR